MLATSFVSLIVALIILGLVVYLIGLLPIDAAIMQVIRVVAIIVAVLYVLSVLFGVGLPMRIR